MADELPPSVYIEVGKVIVNEALEDAKLDYGHKVTPWQAFEGSKIGFVVEKHVLHTFEDQDEASRYADRLNAEQIRLRIIDVMAWDVVRAQDEVDRLRYLHQRAISSENLEEWTQAHYVAEGRREAAIFALKQEWEKDSG